MTIQQGMPFC